MRLLWLSKPVADVVASLHAEKTTNGELRARLASQQTTIDWLITHVNTLTLERAQLYQRIGVYVPVPEIARTSPAPGVDRYEVPDHQRAADVGELLAAARDLRSDAEAQRTRSENAVGAEMPDALAIFEDVGDTVARQIGRAHDDAGQAVDIRPVR